MDQSRTCRTQCRESVSQRLARVRNAAKQRKKEKFTALLHHVDTDLLHEAFWTLKRQAAPGVDGVTWQDYEAKLNENLEQLHRNVRSGRYRAQPVRRRFIPKPDGRQRPLGVTALEDKIIQRAVVMVLNEIYEEDFLGFSYGFRPGRGQHDALDSLAMGIQVARVNWILDADIRSFFDQLDKRWLMRLMEYRVGPAQLKRINVDTTVETKAIRFPTDARLYNRCRERLVNGPFVARLKSCPDAYLPTEGNFARSSIVDGHLTIVRLKKPDLAW